MSTAAVGVVGALTIAALGAAWVCIPIWVWKQIKNADWQADL